MSDIYKDKDEHQYYKNKLIDANGDPILFAVYLEPILDAPSASLHWIARCSHNEIEAATAQPKLDNQETLDFYKFIELWASKCVDLITKKQASH